MGDRAKRLEAAFQAEADRVNRFLEDSILELQAENGSVHSFSAALTAAALRLHAEIFGAEGLERMLSGMATRQLLAARGVQRPHA